jgi:hypothetical protein
VNNAELNRIDEIMSQNIQSSNEQNVNSVQYTIVETILQMKLGGTEGYKLHEGQGGQSESSPLRWDDTRDNQTGRLSCMSSGHKQLKGEHQAWVHSDQMVLVMARQGGWTGWPNGQRLSRESWISSIRQLRGLRKQAEWQPKRKTHLTVPQGMLKRWDKKMMRWEPQ